MPLAPRGATDARRLREGVARRSAEAWRQASGAFAVVFFACGCTSSPSATTFGVRIVDGGFDGGFVDTCSSPTLVLVAPLQNGIGGTGDLHAVAGNSPGRLFFSWSSTPGSRIKPIDATDAKYVCVAPGRQTLTLTATDDRGCEQFFNVTVLCVE
ncbi:MAG TPA: hypothetical protein VH142_06555 [Polyangiaceae bacterium]|nr:hypothetical protein [Polyangiaceae bacterium]